MKKIIVKTIILSIVISLISCNASKNQKSKNQKMFATNYIVEKIENKKELSTKPTIIFNTKENKISGFAGCNRYNGSFIKKENTITFNGIISTKMYCLNMPVEKEFLTALSNTTSYKISENKLVFLDKSDTVLVTFIKTEK